MENYLTDLENNLVRGEILGLVIGLEKSIEYFIAICLCDTEFQIADILSLILGTDRITLSSKCEIAWVIAKHNFPDVFEKDNSLVNGLGQIVSKRNIFAHAFLVTRKESIHYREAKMTFQKHKDKLKEIIFTPEDIDQLKSDIMKYDNLVVDFIGKIIEIKENS